MKIVMIADDSPVIRKVARRLLEDMELVVVEAGDGAQAISMCRDNMPDILIIDWDMPGRSGVDVVAEIARMPASENTVIFYCTSELNISEMTKAKRAGAKGFLMKPFNRTILHKKFMEVGVVNPDEQAA
ncbi:MAG: response regulator [Pseudomonadota bacterium]